MEYSKHLQRIFDDFSNSDIFKDPHEILKNYNENLTDFEKCIIILRAEGFEYSRIQARLGNPSKKEIRRVLLSIDPSLIDIDCNYQKLKPQKDSLDKQIQKKVPQEGIYVDIDGYDILLYWKNGEVYAHDTIEMKVSEYDERTKKVILLNF